MNKFSRIGLTAIALMFFFNIIAVTETKAQLINEILKRMNAHTEALQTLKADIKVDKFNSSLNQHKVLIGASKYIPLKQGNSLIRIDWAPPNPESIVVSANQYIVYNYALQTAFWGKLRDAKPIEKGKSEPFDLMTMSRLEIKAGFDFITYVGHETIGNGTETWHLQLTPKNARNYKMIEFWVDSNGMQVQTRITENNNNATAITLFNLQKNVPIDPKDFILPTR